MSAQVQNRQVARIAGKASPPGKTPPARPQSESPVLGRAIAHPRISLYETPKASGSRLQLANNVDDGKPLPRSPTEEVLVSPLSLTSPDGPSNQLIVSPIRKFRGNPIELPGSPHTSAIIKERRDSSGPEDSERAERRAGHRYSSTPSTASIKDKLSSPRWEELSHVSVREGVRCKSEVENKFQRFIDFLRTASRARARPENDPLRAFRGRWIGIDLVTIRESRRGSRWAPHVRFHGLRNEDEVKYLHACLSKRRFRKEYHAPLEICYFLQDIIPCASRTTRLRRATSSLFTFYRVESARSSEGSLPAGQAAQRIAPKAQFEEPTIASLCGSLISIGSGPARRTVTVGGLVMLGDESFALTAGHTDRPEESEESVQAMHMEVREKDYDADVEPPLIFTTEPRGDNLHSPNPGELTNSQRLLEALDSAPIELSGVDWSLIRVHMPTRRLPNIVPVPRHIKQTSGADAYTYLINAAARPKPGPVYVYGGVSGLKQLTMVHGKNHLRLPSGRWLQAWKAHYKSGSCLHKGDSGAWVFDAHCGDVLGQVVATTDDCIYILPLVDIFRNIRGATGLEPRLPTPFEMLGEMGKVYHLQGNGRLAEQYAREALRAVVLAHSNAGSPGRFLADFLNTFPMRRESVCQVIMRTGPDIVATLPSALTDAQYGLMGDIDGALGILRDLRSYAKDYGLDVSRGDECAGDDDDGAEPASRLGNLYGLLCMGRRHPGRLHRHDEKPERIARLL